MELRLVVAIIRTAALEAVEERLQQMGVRGLTVTRAKGCCCVQRQLTG